MKNIVVLALVLFGLYACNGDSQQSEMVIGQYTTIDIQKKYNKGTVAKGELIKVDIKIKNTGDYPLVIAGVEPACSCTVSEYSKEPIAPGKTTIIKATVDTEKTGTGKINKPINITANTRPSTTTVSIIANVIR